MKKFTLAALAASAAIACLPTLSIADTATVNPAYLVDGSRDVVHNGSGECWRTGAWTPALATAPCDAVLQVPTVIAAAPAPKAVAPTPMAPVAPSVITPMPQKVSFSGDALFAFDKSVLRPESRVLLDDLVRQHDGTTSDVVKVTGHTDRIGTTQYNQKLSERRAAAVKDYLVSKNLQASKIESMGVGESQPVTAATDCKGSKASAKLIACLQSDRRVEVEMTGTKPSTALQ
jgi:OOP family OmpA-OmpF porin